MKSRWAHGLSVKDAIRSIEEDSVNPALVGRDLIKDLQRLGIKAHLDESVFDDRCIRLVIGECPHKMQDIMQVVDIYSRIYPELEMLTRYE